MTISAIGKTEKLSFWRCEGRIHPPQSAQGLAVKVRSEK
jgi:hypothetical protein